MRLPVSKVTVELGRGEWEEETTKYHKNMVFLLTFGHFLCKRSSNCYRSWLNSRILEKLILTIFASVLIVFMEKIFESPSSTILEVL